MELKDRILAARTEADLTQEELARATGKTRGAVAQWESGATRPRHETLAKIANATRKSLDWLLTGKVSEYVTGIRKETIQDVVQFALAERLDFFFNETTPQSAAEIIALVCVAEQAERDRPARKRDLMALLNIAVEHHEAFGEETHG